MVNSMDKNFKRNKTKDEIKNFNKNKKNLKISNKNEVDFSPDLNELFIFENFKVVNLSFEEFLKMKFFD